MALAHQETLHAFEIAKQHSARETAIAEDTIRNLQESMESANEYRDLQYCKLRVERRKIQRLCRKADVQQQELTKLRDIELPAAQRAGQQTQLRLLDAFINSEAFYAASQSKIAGIHSEADGVKALLNDARRRIKILRTQYTRAKLAGARGIITAQEKMRRQSHTYKLMHRGKYSTGVRKLAHALAKSGCSQEQVGPMIRMVGNVMGIKVKGKLSRCTVLRTICEGGVAARIQLGHELAQAKSELYLCYVIVFSDSYWQASLQVVMAPLTETSHMIHATLHTRFR